MHYDLGPVYQRKKVLAIAATIYLVFFLSQICIQPHPFAYYVGPVYFIEAYPLLFSHLAEGLSPKQLTVNFLNSSLRR